MIRNTRIRRLNRCEPGKGRFVLYWMQASQRAAFNHALEYAVREANRRGLPVVVYFGLTDRFPEANLRHFAFMLEGLKETAAALRRRGIALVLRRESPEAGVIDLGRQAVMVVVDRGYTRIQKRWRRAAAAGLEVPLVQVETDVIVPVEAASPKEEYTAGTFRPKILRQLPLYPTKMTSTPARRDSLDLRFDTLDAERPDLLLNALDIDRRVAPSRDFKGGRRAGLRRFRRFLTNHLDEYAELGGDPAADRLSGLSPYLHFGQISPLEIAARVSLRSGPGREAFLEQLIVRRELSMNFVFYNSGYDRYAGLPEWCRRTLREHARDRRNPQYSPEELERAETHDPYWNAAQREMLDTGKMHGYMRMYWGKKILEWTDRPEEAFRIALTLNNRYELDGRDPNGFAGVAWCFGKHDRAWAERPIFGKVRYMNAAGLRRKFAIDEYVRRVSILSG